ncbi:MAG TPA: tetratricopeptide repeat protein [Candidatus Limnocylindria bacterium]|nr:tetratricopeptide repeat protein [Candidatus Limnocylindria bacterium]
MVHKWLALLSAALAFASALSLSLAAEFTAPFANDQRWEQARKDLAQGRAAEAKAGFDELLRQYPNDADLHLFRGMSLLRLRDPQAAILSIKRAIAINGAHVDARTLLGYVELEVRGDIPAAINEYRKVIELRPDSADAHSNLAVAQKKHGDLDAAVISLNRALELKPDHVGALTTRGSTFAELGKWSDARRDFEQALKLNPRDDGALYGLSQALREAREYGGAQSALSQLISRSGNFIYWLEWGRIVMIRYWWALLLIAISWALKDKLRGRFMKARTQANG